MYPFYLSCRRLAPLTATLLFLASCSTSLVDEDPRDTHAAILGLQIVHGEVLLYSLYEGFSTCAVSPCGFPISVGETFDDVRVTFIDEDGFGIPPETLSSAYSMSFAMAHTHILRVEQTGRFTLRVTGLDTGGTTMQITLHHHDHIDLVTPLVSSEAIQILIRS